MAETRELVWKISLPLLKIPEDFCLLETVVWLYFVFTRTVGFCFYLYRNTIVYSVANQHVRVFFCSVFVISSLVLGLVVKTERLSPEVS